jgi:hypothetical protein
MVISDELLKKLCTLDENEPKRESGAFIISVIGQQASNKQQLTAKFIHISIEIGMRDTMIY